jgi:hypothetical protein
MSYKVFFINRKIIILILLLGINDLAYADSYNPAADDAIGPYINGEMHLQNNNTVEATGLCGFYHISPFPGTSRITGIGWCLRNPDDFVCDAGEGSFDNDYQAASVNRKRCYGPERNFDIYNMTGYSINSIYFDGDDYRTNPNNTPTSSIWLVSQPTSPGGVRSTSHGGSRLAVDTDYGMFKGGGVVGNLTIQSDDLDEKSAYNVTQASIVQNNFNNPDGKYLLTSSVTINNPGPHPVATPIACAIPPTQGQFSTDKYSPGKAVLLPSIMEAKLHLCVIAPTTSNQYHFYNIASLYTNLDTDDTKLYPKILDSTYETNFESGYLSESLIYSGTGGRQCSQYDFVVKTKASNCLDLQNNIGSINSANILVAAYDTTGVSPSFTLSFNSDVTVSGDSVKAVYKLHLLNNTSIYGNVYNLVNGGSDNTITCDHGICNGEIDYHPPH